MLVDVLFFSFVRPFYSIQERGLSWPTAFEFHLLKLSGSSWSANDDFDFAGRILK